MPTLSKPSAGWAIGFASRTPERAATGVKVRDNNWRLMLSPRSLAFRVVSLSTVLAVAALIAIATVISTLYQNRVEQDFENLLEARLFILLGAVGLSETGRLQGAPNLGDLGFIAPQSGDYWEVAPLTDAIPSVLRSASMTGDVEVAPVSLVPFDAGFQRMYDVDGLAGEQLRVVETEYVLGDENQVARFRVMGNLTKLAAETRQFRQLLYSYLALFGAGMVIINAGAILFGLAPLGRVRAALASVREGRAEQLDGDFPPEIEPLAAETNALIDNNRKIVERYRTQVGNLAHSLKTPLAVITNEGRASGDRRGALVAEQATAMRRQIDHYLQRARIAAQRDTVVFRTRLSEPLARMVRVLDKLNTDKTFSFKLPDERLVFEGEKEDLEEIVGNLLENAGKWAKSKVVVSAVLAGSTPDRTMIDLIIEDDGPGIPPDKAAEALKRGKRLDESKPGTGLGLSIVADLASEYGGSLSLDRSELGGLKAVVQLPGGD